MLPKGPVHKSTGFSRFATPSHKEHDRQPALDDPVMSWNHPIRICQSFKGSGGTDPGGTLLTDSPCLSTHGAKLLSGSEPDRPDPLRDHNSPF